MTFDDFYNNVFNEDVVEISQKVVISGKKLTEKDCSTFWKLFKKCMKSAYDEGVKSINENIKNS